MLSSCRELARPSLMQIIGHKDRVVSAGCRIFARQTTRRCNACYQMGRAVVMLSRGNAHGGSLRSGLGL